MRIITASLLAASLTAGVAAQENLSTSEQTQVIEKAREVALQYTANLPDFISTETIRRSGLQKGSQTWKLADTVIVDVAFSDKGERYNMLTINGKPTKKTFSQIGGARSSGEFGTTLKWIFRPESFTTFHSQRSEDLRGRPMQVFSFSIEQSHSDFQVNWGKVHMKAAFSGLVYVDRESGNVMRITDTPSGIPASASLKAVWEDLDYGFAEIGGQKFLLPLHAELDITTQDGTQLRNEMDFGNFRKFTSEAVLKFEP